MDMEMEDKLKKEFEETPNLFSVLLKEEGVADIAVPLLKSIDDYYSEDVFNLIISLEEIMNKLDVPNCPKDIKDDLIIMKERIDDYKEVYNDFELHKPLLKAIGLLK